MADKSSFEPLLAQFNLTAQRRRECDHARIFALLLLDDLLERERPVLSVQRVDEDLLKRCDDDVFLLLVD
jgi:hypothetical protein